MKAVVILRYEGTSADKFDRDYYAKHLDWALKEWAPLGAESIRAYFPPTPVGEKATQCICELVCRDEKAMKDILSAPITPTLMADVPNYTNMTLKIGIWSPLA